MKRMWLAYIGVTLLGVLVGVAIAGLPSGGDDVVPPIASVADTSAAETTTSSPVAPATVAVETVTTTSAPATSTTTSTSTSTSTSTTTTTSTTTSTTVPLLTVPTSSSLQ